MVGGIEKPKFSPDVSVSEGFHIVMGTPSICITTQKHNSKMVKANHVRLVSRRKISTSFLKLRIRRNSESLISDGVKKLTPHPCSLPYKECESTLSAQCVIALFMKVFALVQSEQSSRSSPLSSNYPRIRSFVQADGVTICRKYLV